SVTLSQRGASAASAISGGGVTNCWAVRIGSLLQSGPEVVSAEAGPWATRAAGATARRRAAAAWRRDGVVIVSSGGDESDCGTAGPAAVRAVRTAGRAAA